MIDRKGGVSKVIFVAAVMFLVFGGSYKTPIGNISTAHIASVFGLFIYLSSFIVGGRRLKYTYKLLLHLRYYTLYIFLIFTLYILSLVKYSMFGVGDVGFILLQSKILASTFISFFLFSIVVDLATKNIDRKCFFFSTLVFLSLLLVLSLFQLFSLSFRLWFLNLTAVSGYWYEWATTSARAIGLKGMSIWDTSISYAFLAFICFSIFDIDNIHNKRLWFLVYFLILMILVVMSGRTGLITLFILSILLSIKYKKVKFLSVVFLILSLSIVLLMSMSGDGLIYQRLKFAFELIINALSGDFQTQSTNDLINNHLFIPDIRDFYFGDNIFIGDGEEVNSKIGRSSDSAFVINYTAFGLFGLLTTILLSLINTKIITNLFETNRKVVLYASISLILCIGFYTKILLYISPTILKLFIFLTVVQWNLSNRNNYEK